MLQRVFIMKISKDTILRLSQYKNVTVKLKSLGFLKVFSDNLADALGISSSLVRKDFAMFDIKGNKRGGYSVDELIDKLNTILGKKDNIQSVIIIGCGRIGSALLNYYKYPKDGITVKAGFDISPDVKSLNDTNIPIYDISELESFIKDNNVKVAIICVSENSATSVTENLIEFGIEGILNFTPVLLKNSNKCCISNINIKSEIENIFYFVHFANQEKIENNRK
jgi:redox-sensing transcriptional repressor